MIHNQSHEDAAKALFTHYEDLHAQIPENDRNEHARLTIEYHAALNDIHHKFAAPLPPVVANNDVYEPEPEPERRVALKSPSRLRGKGVNNFAVGLWFTGVGLLLGYMLLTMVK